MRASLGGAGLGMRPHRSLLVLSLVLTARRGLAGRVARGSPPRGGGLTGPKAKQSLGQNFLNDIALAKRIASSVPDRSEDGSHVIELGPGQGAISTHLLDRFPRMTAIEIDERMIEHLSSTLPALSVEHGDMLRLDLAAAAAERNGSLDLVSNTPFYLTSPLLFKLLSSVEHINSAVLTTQKEVADKILSPPGSKGAHVFIASWGGSISNWAGRKPCSRNPSCHIECGAEANS